jgi:uncharacterized protein YutE (UPF0331/DUF86 family)
MPINGIVESKLRFLEQTLADLESWPLGDMGEFTRNSMLRRAVERALQLAVESMIDPQIVYHLARNKLACFRDFVDEIRRACTGPIAGPAGDNQR